MLHIHALNQSLALEFLDNLVRPRAGEMEFFCNECLG